MRIAVDAMGSDLAPTVEVEGAVEASLTDDIEVILVGKEAELRRILDRHSKYGKVSVHDASQAIAMGDAPVMAVRQKKDSSLLVALRLVKEGKADGVVSAGNTGAVMVGSRIVLGPIKGVARSALCQMLPTMDRPCLLLDLGANFDCSARHLCEFAEMGMVYSSRALDVANPRVGLLNIGEEQAKGNDLLKTVHRSLTAAPHINFVGNVEPKTLHKADVVVCNGFVGNVVLKTSEASAALMKHLLLRELNRTWLSRIGALFSRGAFKRIRRSTDANEYPGALLLGVNGVVIILHGSCTGRGVANGIRGAAKAAEARINEHIRKGIEELRQIEVAVKMGEQAQ
jgi:phosphate acyltransferase